METEYKQEFDRCLKNMDVEKMRELWGTVFPFMPQPKDNWDALQTLHMVRTASNSFSFEDRAFSHCWLLSNNQVSLLPANLRVVVEKQYKGMIQNKGRT